MPGMAETTDWPARPGGCGLELETFGREAAVVGPPQGLWRGSFYTAAVGPLIFAVAAWMHFRLGGYGAMHPGVAVWVSLIAAAGLALTLLAVDLGTAAVRVEIDDRGVTIKRRSVLRGSSRRIEREDAAAVRVGETWFTAGNRPVHRLELTTRSGKTYAMLTGRPEADLQWAAAVAAKGLGLDKNRR